MTTIYVTSEVCSMDEKTLKTDCSKQWQFNPDLEEIIKKSRNYDLLTYVWQAWHENTGRPILPLYKEFIELSNKGARNDGFADTGDYWRSVFEEPELQSMLEELWLEVLPLYEQLHTYVRRKLRQQYPDRFSTNAIPAHILGDMWAQEWTGIADFTIPYPNKPSIDVTDEMKRQSYTAEKIFRVVDDFYKSMGLIALPPTFWQKSMLEKPTGRDVSCAEQIYDFYRYNDVRMTMCTKVDMRNLIWVSYLLGYAQYYLQYTNQPFTFRQAANPALEDAIGSTVMLSTSTPQYLQKIGLLR
jgi:peptidyl-dipeptidase A